MCNSLKSRLQKASGKYFMHPSSLKYLQSDQIENQISIKLFSLERIEYENTNVIGTS